MFDGTAAPVSGSTSASVPLTIVTIASDFVSSGNGLPTGANVEYDDCSALSLALTVSTQVCVAASNFMKPP